MSDSWGLNLQSDLSWRSHLESGEKPLLQTLRKRLGALCHLGKTIPKSGRLVLLNGLILSKIIYMIAIWGGIHQVHIDKVQKLINKTARYVLQGGWKIKTNKLMETCNWLTANKLVVFHSMLTIWKLLNFQIPSQIAEEKNVLDR